MSCLVSTNAGPHCLRLLTTHRTTPCFLPAPLPRRKASKRTPQVYRAGDSVKIVQGDLKGITGIVASAGGDGTVHVNVDHKDLQGEAIALQASDLARHVTAGMHVRVTSGRHDGATGMVVRLNDEVVVLLTDILKEEIQVGPSPRPAPALPLSPALRLGSLFSLNSPAFCASPLCVSLTHACAVPISTPITLCQLIRSLSIFPHHIPPFPPSSCAAL